MRYVFHVVSGIIFFAEYAPSPDFTSVLAYSTTCNIVILIEVAIIILLLLILPQLRKFLNAQKALA